MWRFPSDLKQEELGFPVDREQILNAIKRLSMEYIPQWHFETEKPDAGSVIAMIFAGQMEEAARAYARLPLLCMEELSGMTDIIPRHAVPARAVLIFEADGACGEGIFLKKGSRFYGSPEDSKPPIVFQTRQELLATPAALKAVLGISSRKRAVVSYLENGGGFPIRLFDFRGENLYRESIQIQHPYLTPGGIEFARPFISSDFAAKRARIQVFGCNLAPSFLNDGERDLGTDRAAIFGEQVSVYKECYIGQDEVFKKAGTKITFAFDLSWGLFDSRQRSTQGADIRLVMKRPQKTEPEEMHHVFPQEISISYYNGKGFKELPCGEQKAALESPAFKALHVSLQFVCPSDWKPMDVGGYESRCIRFRVQRAENCYLPETICHYPVLEHMRFSYKENRFPPKAFLRRRGSHVENLTKPLLLGEEPVIFSGFPYDKESILLGFDQVLGQGWASLYLQLEKQTRGAKLELVYEYSTEKGFSLLPVLDGTAGCLRSGILRFLVPRDAAAREIEGRRCFWIRLTDAKGQMELFNQCPVLYGIFPNAVEAENLYISEEKDFFLDDAVPNLNKTVAGSCIVDAQVWVNENSSLSAKEKDRLMKERREDLLVEYDGRGRLFEFFVKWREIPGFPDEACMKEMTGTGAGDGRHYVLDRREKTIRFGDGKNGRIPSETDGAALKVRVRSCDGSLGNVEAGRITEPARPYTFLRRVYNPGAAYGGRQGDMAKELIDRGRDLLSTGGRLVSERDIIRGAKAFSGRIKEAALLKEDAQVRRLILLMSEAGQFDGIDEGLLDYLGRSFFKGAKLRLIIQEPIFVKVSVNVWLHGGMGGFLEAKECILLGLSSYFGHTGGGGGNWGIGRLPKQEELKQVLYQAAGEKGICYFQTILSYTDADGFHETDLEEIKQMPDAVCGEGSHSVLEKEEKNARYYERG